MTYTNRSIENLRKDIMSHLQKVGLAVYIKSLCKLLIWNDYDSFPECDYVAVMVKKEADDFYYLIISAMTGETEQPVYVVRIIGGSLQHALRAHNELVRAFL